MGKQRVTRDGVPTASLGLRVTARAVAWLLRLLGSTWRIQVEGEDAFAAGHPVIAATWHRGLLVAAYWQRGRPLAVAVSQSRDGERIAAVLRALGFAESPRGSSSRGATGLLRALVRRVHAGDSVGFLPDGPRGPAGRLKPGPVSLARLTGAPLVPIGIAAHPCKRFGSWDRAILPYPFAQVICRYGTPLHVPKNASRSELETWSARLEKELQRLNDSLDARIGSVDVARQPQPEAREEGDS